MANLRVINSSSAREDSMSRALVEAALARFTKADPDAVVVCRDLGASPNPHWLADRLAGVRGVPRAEVEISARVLSAPSQSFP
jgi:FMN-dependent NADH-azoreductase